MKDLFMLATLGLLIGLSIIFSIVQSERNNSLSKGLQACKHLQSYLVARGDEDE